MRIVDMRRAAIDALLASPFVVAGIIAMALLP